MIMPTRFTVGDLEEALLGLFPASEAEPWDRTGLVAGDAQREVASVAVALDPTFEAIGACRDRGANVLITHHPLFLDPPSSIAPKSNGGDIVGARVWEAVRSDVSCLSFHTALDVSDEGARMIPGLLGLEAEGIAVPIPANPSHGYGQICSVTPKGTSLLELARRCERAFGRPPRLWGDPNSRPSKVVCATGSAGNVIEASLRAGADCLVCGEVKYHAALDARERGLSIIELGHDVSELPFVGVLARALEDIGVPSEMIHRLDQGSNWLTV